MEDYKEKGFNSTIRCVITAVLAIVIMVFGIIIICYNMFMPSSASATNLNENAENAENANEIYPYEDNNNESIYIYTDPETGVQYLIFKGYRKAGMTPRLDKNGNVMVQETAQETLSE